MHLGNYSLWPNLSSELCEIWQPLFRDILNYKNDMNNILNHSETAKCILLEGIKLRLIHYNSLNQLWKTVVMVCPQLDKYVSVCVNQQGDSYYPHVIVCLLFFLQWM